MLQVKNLKFIAALVLALGAGASQASAAVKINEVLADPPKVDGDSNRDGEVNSIQDEFVELINTASSSISLEGWTLSDKARLRHEFGEGDQIGPNGFYLIFGGGEPDGFANSAVASKGSLGLNNTGDTLTLRDADGNIVDTFTYGPEGNKDASLTRYPDASGSFALHDEVGGKAFSPGTTIDGQRKVMKVAEE